ncbi:hypothetical protein-signal peptide prediction [Vibrio ishigakensis]|uniref:Uncharacterized protein n=1 Tax=Vibrio ishigakensis TaxID=1481914 RepID=A0A0B8P4Z8_9VIBR|nr:hypothetical protein-signal peptide prediction [Vibrio ishigakensis]
MTDVKYNTVHAMNHEFYDEINTLIQYEPTEVFDPEWLSMAQAIGIEKGKEFNPDERMQRILEEAAKIATADIRSAYHDPNKTRPRWMIATTSLRWSMATNLRMRTALFTKRTALSSTSWQRYYTCNEDDNRGSWFRLPSWRS